MEGTDTKMEEDTVDKTDELQQVQEGQFVGATLEISENGPAVEQEPDVPVDSALSRNRPGSMMSTHSVRSTTSRISLKPNVVKTDATADTFFSYKGTSFETSVAKCKTIIKAELDGELTGSWLMTEIDHWDMEHEKILLLTEFSLLVCKFNFITQKLLEFKRILLHAIDTIAVGDFRYPEKSFMPDRQHGGIQLRWNQGQGLLFGQKWNPFATDIPYITLCDHPLLYNHKESETVTYNCNEFYESLIQVASKAYEVRRPNEKITVVEGPILIESYASLASIIYNQSSLGFFRERNGVSF